MSSLLHRQRRTLPGFGLSLGCTIAYTSLLVLFPLIALAFKAASLGGGEIWRLATSPRALAAYQLSFMTAGAAALLNAVLGSLVAWVIVRYPFKGRAVMDALIDLPFALPTAVSGIALTTLYATNGMLGRFLGSIGIPVAFTPVGITLALTFVGFPFVVRTVQPVIEALDPATEEAAAVLGASSTYTFFRITLPQVLPAIVTGFALAFARALGEYGSVVFIAGNMPLRTEIVPLLIMTRLEEYDYAGAAALAMVMLVISCVILLALNWLESRARPRYVVI